MYNCEICGKKFEKHNSLNAHKAYHSKEERENTKKKKEIRTGDFKCIKCDKNFKLKANYDKHIVKCAGKKKHVCKYCGKEFETGGALGGHIGVVHSKNSMNNKKKFKCEICNKILFTSTGSFEMHIKLHNEDFYSERNKKISDTKKDFFADDEKSKKYINYLSNRMQGNAYGKDNADKISKSLKKYFSSLNDKDYSKVVENFINAPKKGHSIKHSGKYTPTKIEQMIIDLRIDGLEYNGNKKNATAIRFENKKYKKSVVPDFIYKDNKRFIETFGNYWHPKEDEEKYIKAYRDNGYEVLILWEEELYNNFEECKNKIFSFLKN